MVHARYSTAGMIVVLLAIIVLLTTDSVASAHVKTFVANTEGSTGYTWYEQIFLEGTWHRKTDYTYASSEGAMKVGDQWPTVVNPHLSYQIGRN